MNTSPRPGAALLALAALAAACLTACARPPQAGSVTVLGPWAGTERGTEGYAFRRIIAAFEAETGVHVTYQDTRALPQVLLSNVQGGTPPNVAILSGVGELARYARAGDMFPLDGVVPPDRQAVFPRQWLLPQRDGSAEHIYTVPVKANLKSLVWFNRTQGPRPVPQTWAGLMAYTRSVVDRGGTPWCMGMGDPPSSGWPGTDLIEDILLRQAGPDAFQHLSAGVLPWNSGPMARAWTTWSTLVGPTQLRGGPHAAVLTDFQDAGRALFDDPPKCYLDHQASFIMSFYQKYEHPVRPGVDFDFFPFPSFTPRPAEEPWEASADLAGMFDDTPQTRQFMRFLAGDEVSRIWAESVSGAFSVNRNTDPRWYPDPVSKRIANVLATKPLCLDAADVMPAAMRAAFYRAVLEYLDGTKKSTVLLDELEQIRRAIPTRDWTSLPCGR
ncbi:MAG TPA: ABC transporter substrate-binding protein [Mycobacteriales bacterium]|nr:ABC transporter substrate-binding protein [Mycobacteriales bacterium]